MITTPRVDALIERDADAFFEWPTADRTHVSTASMLLFAAMIARKARAAALEEAANACEERGAQFDGEDVIASIAAELCAARIRAMVKP